MPLPPIQLTPQEMKVISALANQQTDVIDETFIKGLFIAGERYTLALANGDDPIYCRRVSPSAAAAPDDSSQVDEVDTEIKKKGVIIVKTIQSIIIAHHLPDARQAATLVVTSLADCLKKAGY